MIESYSVSDMNILDLIMSGDEIDESSDGFELDSSLKAGMYDASTSETLNNFYRDSQGKASNIMTATASDGTTTIDPSCGATSREEGGQIETTPSGSSLVCGASGGRNDDDLTGKERSSKNT